MTAQKQTLELHRLSIDLGPRSRPSTSSDQMPAMFGMDREYRSGLQAKFNCRKQSDLFRDRKGTVEREKGDFFVSSLSAAATGIPQR